MKWLLVLLAVFAMTAAAADVSGTWKATVETPNGAMETTFVFKVDAGKVTGTTTMGQMGETAISEGKVDGDTVTFAVVRQGQNGEFRINYSGKATGDEMKITATIPAMDRTFEMTAKRAK
uniref:Lipocalin-like domain-containing protein n=1 Tax=Solibacter usitatus (strain Ellin6076) TaxID=234267 RepID=Q01QE2_SOLUE